MTILSHTGHRLPYHRRAGDGGRRAADEDFAGGERAPAVSERTVRGTKESINPV